MSEIVILDIPFEFSGVRDVIHPAVLRGGAYTVLVDPVTRRDIFPSLPEQDALIAGDAAVLENGELALANPQFTLDREAAERSLEVVRHHRARRILCYHGGELRRKI